jgi:hypothetical protein
MQIFRLLLCIGALSWSPAVMAKPWAPAIESTIPGVSKISLSNAVGVLNYCKENALLSGESVGALVDALSRKADLTSEDYIVGSSGQILGDAGRNLSIFRAPGHLQSQACNVVLERTNLFPR